MTQFKVIEERVNYGEAFIEADTYEQALKLAQKHSEENYDDFEWSDVGRRLSLKVRLSGEMPKDLWEEKARPGHIVRIVSQGVQSRWPYEATVTYEHVGVHNQRAQSANTVSAEKNFLKRFKSCGVSEA